MPEYAFLVIGSEFVESYGAQDFSFAERQRFRRALQLLDENEQHPSLRVHRLQGKDAGVWSLSASDELRITFKRLPDGKKLILRCSRHYHG